MFLPTSKNSADTVDIISYIKSVLMYTLFLDNSQNNEYQIRKVADGFIFVPVYPVTYVIDGNFYNKIFTILNLALTPMYTMIRPLTMQVVTLSSADSSQARGLFFPARKGKPKRLEGTIPELMKNYKKTGTVPIMDLISWDFVKSPHAIITGVSGSGKSYFLRYLFMVCSLIGDVIAIDPKASDLARISKDSTNSTVIMPAFAKDASSDTGIGGKFLQDVITTLKRVESTLYHRQSELFKKTTRISTDYRELKIKPIFIFIDELAALMTGASKQVKIDFQDTLTRLTVLGREAGVYLVLSMQSARAEFIPTIVRDSISLRVQLGRINSENARFLFPELSEIPIVPMGGKGSGIISIAGDTSFSGVEPVLTPTIFD